MDFFDALFEYLERPEKFRSLPMRIFTRNRTGGIMGAHRQAGDRAKKRFKRLRRAGKNR